MVRPGEFEHWADSKMQKAGGQGHQWFVTTAQDALRELKQVNASGAADRQRVAESFVDLVIEMIDALSNMWVKSGADRDWAERAAYATGFYYAIEGYTSNTRTFASELEDELSDVEAAI